MGTAVLASALEQLRTMVHAKACEELSDRQLLEQFLIQREEAAFVALLQRHGPMVLQVCRRVHGNEHDAEDVFQATFLLLARKAGSIRKPESLASWLHGVAQRLAMKARAQETRRQALERRAADMRSTGQVSDATWQELQRTLDEALRQVPEKYRLPLLICYLEGKTQEEAARQLGCPLGTVRSRLARGRERLRTVLERKGVSLSAAALTAGLAESSATASVPPLMVQATARAALAYAAGKAAAAVVSVRTAAFVEEGLKAMLTTQIKLATIVLLAVGTLSLGSGALITRVAAGLPQVTQPNPSAARQLKGRADGYIGLQNERNDRQTASQNAAGAEGPNKVTIHGRVLGTDGKPLVGAKLLLSKYASRPVELGSTAADGQFAVEIPKDNYALHLIARSDNACLDFIGLTGLDPSAPIELRLVKDRIIRGRVINTEGKPAAGVHVKVRSIAVFSDKALEPFLAEWKRSNFNFGLPAASKYLGFSEGYDLDTTTDADGRFTLAGTGVNRLVGIRLSGPGIGDEEVRVLNCDGIESPKPYIAASAIMPPPTVEKMRSDPLLYGPDPTMVVEAEKLIQGVVIAADTGQPRAGVEVVLPSNADSLLGLFLTAKTDAQGRYEIRGARKCKGYTVQVKSDPIAGYLSASVGAADTPGYQPVVADIRVPRGVVVTGRVIDMTTGQGIPGSALTEVLPENPFAKDYSLGNRVNSADDGTYRLVTIPGPVLLAGLPDYSRLSGRVVDWLKYKLAVPDPRYPQYFANCLLPAGRPGYRTFRGGIAFLGFNYCKVLQLKPGTAIVHEDILLEQAPGIPVQIRDGEGHPLPGTWVTGISPNEWTFAIRIESDSGFAYEVTAGKPRLMVFYAPDKNLAGTLRIRGDEKQPAVAKLAPIGAVTGRLVTEAGKPAREFVIRLAYADREAIEISRQMNYTKPQLVTDAEGAFRIDGLIPGVDFSLYHYPSGSSPQRSTVLAEKLTVQPGETRALGDLRAKPETPE